LKLYRSQLERWRKESGLTLQEVSDLTGLSVSMLSRVERGERTMSPMTRVQLARRLGVAIHDLFEVDVLEVAS
jgi:transcriptional regulator with XRE-family HTH domain